MVDRIRIAGVEHGADGIERETEYPVLQDAG